MRAVFVESGREVTEVPKVVEGTVVVLTPAIGFEDMVVEEAREDREEVRREIIEDMLFLGFASGLSRFFFPPALPRGSTRCVRERQKK